MKISDLEDLYLVYSNDQVMKYVEPTFSLEKTREFIEKFGLIETPLVYSIEVKNTSKVIGHFIFHFFEDNKTYEIGFILNNQYWNKGYASEILKEIANLAKENNFDLVIECDKNNSKMIHLAEKFNFEKIEDTLTLFVYKLQNLKMRTTNPIIY